MYISSCLFSLISSGLLVTSRCILSLCPALSCLDVLIKYYYLSLRPRLRVPVPPSCVHCDRRPDLTVSGAHSPRFVFRFQKSLFLFQCVCLSRGKEVAARNPAIAHCKRAWEFGGIAASPLATSPHARRSREISAAAVALPSPPTGCLVPGFPLPQARRLREITPPTLTQCPPARH